MVELLDNTSQFLITLLAGVGAGILYDKNRKQVYVLLACFFATYSLATLYWTLYVLLFNQTPQIFYVSELGWVASSMFLLTLAHTLSTPDERRFKHPTVWLVPLVCVPQLLLYLSHGEIFFNLLFGSMTMLTASHSF